MAAVEGSKVRLVGIKDPELNHKVGSVSHYTQDGERVMVQIEGWHDLVRVKPKQVELLEGPAGEGGGGRQDSYDGGARGGGRHHPNGSSHVERESNRSVATKRSVVTSSGVRRVPSAGDSRDAASDAQSQSGDKTQGIFEALRSADAMFELADTSGDGVISQMEYISYMRKHTNHEIRAIRESFFSIDVDGNGDITREEVRTAFLKKKREAKAEGMGGKSTSKATMLEDQLLEASRDADALFERADVNKDNSLSTEEFLLFMKKNTDHSTAAIRELFEFFDADKDGEVTREEVRKALHTLSKGKEGGKLTLAELLYLEDDKMAGIEDDVYNILFLSKTCSVPFWFAIFVFVLKLFLINIIAADLYTVQSFPISSEVPFLVKMAQFLLIPVNVAVQEELITTYYVYANLKWTKRVMELHPGATWAKYHLANFMRFLDGICFLFINTTLLLQADNVVGAFLNFAALQFLSTIDNVALLLARDGYLTDSLQDVAQDVELMTMPKNSGKLQLLDTIMLAVTYVLNMVAWVIFTFWDPLS